MHYLTTYVSIHRKQDKVPTDLVPTLKQKTLRAKSTYVKLLQIQEEKCTRIVQDGELYVPLQYSYLSKFDSYNHFFN